MTEVTSLAPAVEYDAREIVAKLFGERINPQTAEQLVAIAGGWMPQLGNGKTFTQEMSDRICYMHGSMWGDMDQVLQTRFPQTYQYIKDQQLNLNLYARIVNSKAKVFYGQGNRFYLIDEQQKELSPGDPSQIKFNDMLKRGRWMAACKTADRYVQALTRCLVRPWWDERNACVQFSVWPQHMVYWVPCSAAYYSADDCLAVLLKMPGRGTLSSSDARYEVWAKMKFEDRWRSLLIRIGSQMVSGKGDDSKPDRQWYLDPINETNENPFVDEDGEPIYPFVWWQGDGLNQLYNAGSEDALTVPRQLNAGITAMNHSLHYNSDPIGYWEPTVNAPSGNPPAVAVMGPGTTIDGGEYRPAFAHPEYDGKQVLGIWKDIIDTAVQMDIGTSTGVVQEDAAAESGLSVQIKRQPLYEYRRDMIDIYRPYVLETLRRAIIVHNYYAETEADEIRGTPCWEPGDIVDVQDKDAEARQWAIKIETGAATVVDQVMHETGMDEKQALTKVVENLKLTAKLRKLMDGGDVLPDISMGDDEDEQGDQATETELESVEQPEATEAPAGAPLAGKSTTGGLEKVNIYQIAKAIELGAATNVDMRMALFGEDRQTAERSVLAAMEHNKQVAAGLGEAKANEQAPLIEAGAKPKPSSNVEE